MEIMFGRIGIWFSAAVAGSASSLPFSLQPSVRKINHDKMDVKGNWQAFAGGRKCLTSSRYTKKRQKSAGLLLLAQGENHGK